jgi:hypothetical protein
MGIQWRPMRPKDVQACVEIVAAHPAIGPRYGNTIRDLPAVWLGLLGREGFRAVVFESAHNSHSALIGVGASAFVSDDFLLELKTPPYFWVGPELTRRIAQRDDPLLSDKQMREANSGGGLNLVTWEGALNQEHLSLPEAHSAVFSAFVEQHRGFRLKEVVGHGMTEELLEGTLRSGASILDTQGRYVESLEKPIREVFASPHYVGLNREMAMSRIGSWIGSLFIYQVPQFQFRPSEQRMLLAALPGGTDEELSEELGVSLSAIKKTWALIYERAAAHLAGFPSNHDVEDGISERGKEKRRRLLNYLRDHPEELRPASP